MEWKVRYVVNGEQKELRINCNSNREVKIEFRKYIDMEYGTFEGVMVESIEEIVN